MWISQESGVDIKIDVEQTHKKAKGLVNPIWCFAVEAFILWMNTQAKTLMYLSNFCSLPSHKIETPKYIYTDHATVENKY